MNFPNNFKYDVRGGNFERDMESEYVGDDMGDMGGEYVDDQSYIDQSYIDGDDDGFQGGYQEDVFDDVSVMPPPPPPIVPPAPREEIGTVARYNEAAPRPAGSAPIAGGYSGSYVIEYEYGPARQKMTHAIVDGMWPDKNRDVARQAGVGGRVYLTLKADGKVEAVTRVASVAEKGPPVAPPRSQPVVDKGPPVAPPRSQPAPLAKGPPVAPPRSQPATAGKGPPVAPPRSQPAVKGPPAVPGPTPTPAKTVIGTVIKITPMGGPTTDYTISFSDGKATKTTVYRWGKGQKVMIPGLKMGSQVDVALDAQGNVMKDGVTALTIQSKAGAIAVDNNRAPGKISGSTVTVVGTVTDGNASGSIKDLNVPAWYTISYAFGKKPRTYKHNIVVKQHTDRLANGTKMTLILDSRTGNVKSVVAPGPAPAPPTTQPGASLGAPTTITPAAKIQAPALITPPAPVNEGVSRLLSLVGPAAAALGN